MNDSLHNLIDNLNHSNINIRLDSLRELMNKIESGEMQKTAKTNDVNNHIHTTYSFSPYSPTKAIWMAYNAGLSTAGIMDHDSISGAQEFIQAGKTVGISTTIGVECRADFSNTPLCGRRINNPDQHSIAYVALHGIPHTQIDKVKQFFKPYTNYRNIRNKQMVEKLNDLIEASGITLDFEKDITAISKSGEGGSITERHILYALSLKLIDLYGIGVPLLNFLEKQLKLNISPTIKNYLTDEANPYHSYDLLGLLKSQLVNKFYLDAAAECPSIQELIHFSDSIGAISAYAYLGDVGDSVTGDKKTQKFEDDYIDLLFTVLKELKFNAVTYMPSRNSFEQLEKVRKFCDKYGFFQISGEDINSPRQPFICQALRNEKFRNLLDAAWALIGHELAATEQLEQGMFSAAARKDYPELQHRINIYKKIGLQSVLNAAAI